MIAIILLLIFNLVFPHFAQAQNLDSGSADTFCKKIDIVGGSYDPITQRLKLDASAPTGQILLKDLTIDKIGGQSVNNLNSNIFTSMLTPAGNPFFRAIFPLSLAEFKKLFPQTSDTPTSVKKSVDFKIKVGNNQGTVPCNNGDKITYSSVPIALPTKAQIDQQVQQQPQTPPLPQPLPLPAFSPKPIPTCRPGDIRCTLGGGLDCSDARGPAVQTAIGCIHTTPFEFVKDFMKFIIAISGGLAFLMMLVGAYQMLTSAGNPDSLNAGRERLTQAVIGLLFVIFAVLLMQIIGVDILFKGLPGFGR